MDEWPGRGSVLEEDFYGYAPYASAKTNSKP